MPSIEPALTAQRAPVVDEEEPDEISWNLGFVEEPEKAHILLRHRFPSKVGGRPAWLDPVRLPTREMLTCKISGKPLDFLMQIYAPVDVNPVMGFHRSLFLFVSPEGSRLREPGSVRLFRCQLPRHNPYYSSEPPTSKDTYPQPLQPSDAEASRERDPWRSVDAEQPPTSTVVTSHSAAAIHRRDRVATVTTAPPTTTQAARTDDATAGELAGCIGSDDAGCSSSAASTAAAAPLPRTGVRGPGGLYRELELVVEPESDYRDEEEEEEQQAGTAPSSIQEGRASERSAGGGGGRVDAEVQRALQLYQVRLAEEGELDDEELPPDVVEAVEGAIGPEQRLFADFQARVSWAPEQVIRYCFQDGAQPLWPAPHRRPGPGDIPPCPACGSHRKMEFQVLPQLLHYLLLDEEDPDSPDWSVLVAYTCAASCSPPSGQAGEECSYMEEVVWVQPPAP